VPFTVSYASTERKELDMTVSTRDAEAITKAHQGASLLADDLKQLSQSENPLLAELAVQLIRDALDLEQRLNRLSIISNPA
jgi:hypothetical protein